MEGYALPRGSAEAKRLDQQHRLWTENIGYFVHPTARHLLGENARIADVGTGTGIYLLELSEQLPKTCQLNGFDISDAQFPEPQAIPQNVSLMVHDAKKGFDESLHEIYDFVHIRLMVSGLDESDWKLVTSNIVRLLKPGGVLQWAEADFLGSEYFRGNPNVVPMMLDIVGTAFHKSLGHRLGHGYSGLPNLLEQHGMHDVFQDIVPSDRAADTRCELTKVSYDGIFGWAERNKHLLGAWDSKIIRKNRSECKNEIEAGCYCRFNIYVTIGTNRV